MTLYHPTVTPSQRAIHARHRQINQRVADAAAIRFERKWLKANPKLNETPAPEIPAAEPKPPNKCDERAWTITICGVADLPRRPPSVNEIIRAVSAECRVSVIDIVSARCAKKVVLPRHIAMLLARRLTHLSMSQIGQRMGGRDHTTILHGVRSIEQKLASDPALAEVVERISAALLKGNTGQSSEE